MNFHKCVCLAQFHSLFSELKKKTLFNWCRPDKKFSTDYGSDTSPLYHMYEKKAEEFMKRLDDKQTVRKRRLEAEFQELQMRGHLVPKHIPAQIWQRFLTVPSSQQGRLQYLAELADRERNLLENGDTSQKTSGDMCQLPCGLGVIDENDLVEKYTGYASYRSLLLGQPLVFDLAYEMTAFEQERTLRRLVDCYKQNMLHKNPFFIHCTGYKNSYFGEGIKLYGLKDTWFARFYEDDFTELFNANDMIYLSPEGPVLDSYDCDKTYVIGGYVNISSKIDRTLSRARELGVEPRRFPMADYGVNTFRKDLGLNAVMDILLEASLSQSWEKAIYKSLVCTERPEELARKDGTGAQRMWKERYERIQRKIEFPRTEQICDSVQQDL